MIESKFDAQPVQSGAYDACLEETALELAVDPASTEEMETADLKERLRLSKEARAVNSTGFDNHMNEVNMEVASSKAARAEVQNCSAQRISQSNEKADHANSELAVAKQSWADEREEMATIMTDLRKEATVSKECLSSAEEAMAVQRERLQQIEEARTADSTRFDTHMAEVKAQLASSEAARAEEWSGNTHRISLSDAKADRAINELVTGKKSWADERHQLATTIAGLREEVAECMDHLESAEGAMGMQQERLRRSEEARAADSTRFDTHIVEVNAQLASSEAARVKERKCSRQRLSSLNEKAGHAISQLVAAKRSWADERQELATIMTGLREDVKVSAERLVSTEEEIKVQRERLRKNEEVRVADSTRFNTYMAEVNAQLASSKAARMEQQKGDAQRLFSANERADHAMSELVTAKQSWTDERQEMDTTMTDLRENAKLSKERLVCTEDAMVTQQVTADERASTAVTKVTALEASVACLEKELAECKYAEHTSLARESILQKEVAELRNRAAEKRALEVDREAAFARERELQAAANDAIAAERAAWNVEREKSLQRYVKLEQEASALKIRELSAKKELRAMEAEAEKSALAGQTAVSDLENSLVKSKRALLAEQVAASARSLEIENEHASQLRAVHKRLALCEAARKEEREESALALSISEKKVAQTIEQLVAAEDARCGERNEMIARFATLQRESADGFKKHETAAEETIRALKAAIHQREASLQAELVNMRECLAAAEGRFDTEHAESTRYASRLRTLEGEINALRQRLVETDETQVKRRVNAEEDLRIVHQELGKLQTRAERENERNSDLVARCTELERIERDKQQELRLQAETLVKERNAANDLLRNQEIARTEERMTTAKEMSALKKVLNGLRRIELAEQRSLQVDRFVSFGCESTVAMDGDHQRQSTVAVGEKGTSRFEERNTGPGTSTAKSHAMMPQRSSASRREATHLKQGLSPDKNVPNTKKASPIDEVFGLASRTDHELLQGTRSAYTRGESSSASVSPVISSGQSTSSIDNHVMANQRSSASCRETIHLERDLPPNQCSRSTKQVPVIKGQSYIVTDVAYEPFQGTRSARARSKSSPASVSSVRSPDPVTRSAGDPAMAPQWSSALRCEAVHLDQGLLSNKYVRGTKQVPSINKESGLASGAEPEGFEGTRSACTRGEASSATVLSVRSLGPSTGSVEDHAMVPQWSFALCREATHLEQGLPPDRYVCNTKQIPVMSEVSGLTRGADFEALQGTRPMYTIGVSSCASVSSVMSSDMSTRAVEDHAMAPQRSSASRRELIHLEQGSLHSTFTRNQQVTATIEESDLATGAESEALQGTRSMCTKGESSSPSISPSLASGSGLHAMLPTAEVLRATVRPEEVRLGRDLGRPHVATRISTTRNEAFSSLDNS